ncbi:MAG: hypothetical protein ACTTIZ_03105 [Treponema sp.]
MSRNTIFICIGGTGTQVGTAIGTLYPLLKSSKIAGDDDIYSMFILDKDTLGDNYRYCVKAQEDYKTVSRLLPFDVLPAYELHPELYQELQSNKKKDEKNEENSDKEKKNDSGYTVMEFIGDDPLTKDLAYMCWKEEKHYESLSDGNNRDPSRGAIDAHVSLKNLKNTSLFEKLETLISDNVSVENIRLVILAGITGGMGASLIIPFMEEIKEEHSGDDKLSKIAKIPIDLIILGPYFTIPTNHVGEKVDDIGSTDDSYYRARDQISELREFISQNSSGDNKWHVYYVGLPDGFDDICGEFKKNKANKRHAHLVELIAALESLHLAKKNDDGYYDVQLKSEDKKIVINWDKLPLDNKIKFREEAKRLMKLIVIVATELYPRFAQKNLKDLKKDVFIKMYIKHVGKNGQLIDAIKTKINDWLLHTIPYFTFWNEIRLYSKLGGNSEVIIDFFDEKDMKRLTEIFERVIDEPCVSWEKKPLNQIPLCKKTWMNYISAITLDKKSISNILNTEDNSEALLSLMISDIYEVLKKEN